MSVELQIHGQWPSPISITRSWARANARPWNDETAGAFLRLERGNASFLRRASERLVELSGHDVYSPPVFANSARIWERSGYEPEFSLDVMEKSLARPVPRPERPITESSSPDWSTLKSIDASAFRGFWRMSTAGLQEAVAASPLTGVLTVDDGSDPVAYAVVGMHWSVAYLHRIAVRPGHSGQGYGTDLLRAGASWGRRSGAPVMLLNVRPANKRAIGVYQKEGFTRTGTPLKILRYAA